MATSGVYSFNQTRDEIILDTLINLNVIGGNETSIPSDELGYATRALNRIIKKWSAVSMPLWSRKEGVLFLQYNQASYDLGSTSTDKVANSFTNTTTSAAASSAATAITVTSATGFSADQNIGIKLSTGYLQWTTIASVAGTTINLDDALTSSVESGAIVYTCTAGIQRPLKIIDARLFDISNSLDIPMNQINYVPYMQQPQKTLTIATPTQFAYNPSLDNGKFYVYPTPSTVEKVIKFTYHNPIQDFNASTDNADFPVEWLDAIMAELSAKLALKYDKYQQLPALVSIAEKEYKNACMTNKEQGNLQVKIVP